MISSDIFETCVRRAALAPTVHNTQPARWRRAGNRLTLLCDTDVGLTVHDPDGQDAALSCGAVLEGMLLALSAHLTGADVTLTGRATHPGQGLVEVAHLALRDGTEEGLNKQLEQRFTWRGPFAKTPAQLFGWMRADTRLILDEPGRRWLAQANDHASFEILQNAGFRHELVSWMRLQDGHPRAGRDGMDRAALRMRKADARRADLMLRRLWPVLTRLGAARRLVSEEGVTLTAPVIALFHVDISENPVTSGRAYLRLCLEAANLGFAGWPMAAMCDHTETRRDICARFGIPPGRRLVQVIRFGTPTGAAPPRARRPLNEIVV